MKKMQNRKNGITIDQKQFIRDNYKTMSNKEIGKILNIDPNKVKQYGANIGITKEQYLIPNKRFSIITNNDYSYIYDGLCKSKEPIVNNLYKSKYGKYSINQNYFDIIDNEWKAYWLGFLYADGCNNLKFNKNKNKMTCILKVSLKSTDDKHLEKLRESLQSDIPIKYRDIKLNGNIYKDCEVNFCNEKICKDLNKNGCTPKKSLTLKFPTEDIVPKEYIRHFIRGYFDGDGCVHINLNEDNKCTKKSFVINFVGTEDMLNGIINNIIDNIGITPVGYTLPCKGLYQKKNNKAYSCSFNNLFDIEKLFLYLYKDSNIYLDRKLEVFKKVFN